MLTADMIEIGILAKGDIVTKQVDDAIQDIGSPIVIPVGAVNLSMRVFRDDFIDEKEDTTLTYGYAISLDGGVSWGGEYVEIVKPEKGLPYSKIYPLTGSSTTGGRSVIETAFEGAVLGQDAARGTELPQPNNPLRMVRCVCKASKQMMLGVKIVFGVV